MKGLFNPFSSFDCLVVRAELFACMIRETCQYPNPYLKLVVSLLTHKFELCGGFSYADPAGGGKSSMGWMCKAMCG
ncbi:MAG: hypothetical protein KF862_26160 [Chitinophagaceae bacterium]|nr:hypothetical protein [Chitinophagaceae bacterium]